MSKKWILMATLELEISLGENFDFSQKNHIKLGNRIPCKDVLDYLK